MLEEEIINKLKLNMNAQCDLETSVPKTRLIFVRVNRKCLKDIIQFLSKEGFTHLSAITALEMDDAIELLYHLYRAGTELTLRVKLPLNEISVPTITDIIPGASLYEREIHDLFGVKFEGHPDLRRLVLPDEWPNGVHPLRKKHTST